jgi:hypothetical protein
MKQLAGSVWAGYVFSVQYSPKEVPVNDPIGKRRCWELHKGSPILPLDRASLGNRHRCRKKQ